MVPLRLNQKADREPTAFVSLWNVPFLGRPLLRSLSFMSHMEVNKSPKKFTTNFQPFGENSHWLLLAVRVSPAVESVL